MRKIDDIKVIVFNDNDREERITSRFLQLRDREMISYSDEEGLSRVVAELKGRGLKSKEVIILKRFLGRIFQKCPGSNNMICCNYRLLNTCFDCLYNCAYCFLNSYLNAYGIMQFTHIDHMAEQIGMEVDGHPEHVYRIGTGEFTDSMMMDQVTGIAPMLIRQLAGRRNVMIEFKTKSYNIDHILDIENRGNAVLAWSLNTPGAIRLYEEDTASLEERLAAAKKAQEAGYFLAFHFDPMIVYEGMRPEYEALVHRLFSVIDPDRVVWISLGCFRHSPGFKEIVMEKFPGEHLTTAEMFPGIDGKMRYLRKTRVELYGMMLRLISSYSKKPFVYMCMESSDVWKDVFGVDYSHSDDLERAMSDHMKKEFIQPL